jgi:hypothetical protein
MSVLEDGCCVFLLRNSSGKTDETEKPFSQVEIRTRYLRNIRQVRDQHTNSKPPHIFVTKIIYKTERNKNYRKVR